MERKTRRQFLQMATGFAGAAILAACGGEAATAVPATALRATVAATVGGTAAPAATIAPTVAPMTAGATTAPAVTAAPAATTAPAAATTGTMAQSVPAKKVGGTIRYLLRAGSPDEVKTTQAFLDANFTKQTDVKVSVEPTDANADEKLTAAMIGGTAQDVFDTWLGNITQYADRGQVLDVNPLVQRDFKDADIKDFFAWQWKDFVLPSGLRFGVPKYVNTMFVYYNMDMFEKAGIKPIDDTWTHDTYADAAKKLTQGSTTGLWFPSYGTDRWWYKVAAFGGNVVDPADNTKAAFDAEPAQVALEWIRKGTWDDKFIAQKNNIVGTGQRTFDAVPAAFASGRLGMVEDGFYPFVHAKAIGNKFKWAYAPVPKGPSGRKTLGTADGFAIWKGSKNPDAAWELLKYLSGKEYQLYLTQTTGYLPCRYSALDDFKKVCIAKYPELANANIDVGRQAMEQGYPGNAPLFKKDGEAQAIIMPALEKMYIVGSTPVTYMKDVAQQVTTKMRV